MGETFGVAGFGGDLKVRKLRRPSVNGTRTIRTPFGRVILTKDKGDSHLVSSEQFITNLHAVHRDGDGALVNEHDLGSGLVTNLGTLAMSNDFAWPTATATIALNTLRVANNHATGVGVTGAAVSDIKLGTPSAFGGQTLLAGAQSFVTPTNLGTAAQAYKTIATVSYTGTETVSEWGLFGNLGAIGGTALSSSTGSPLTGTQSAVLATLQTASLTASANGVQGQTLTVLENTNATRVSWGLVTSNTTAAVSIPAWYKTADGTAGTTGVAADVTVFRPILWDRKQFTGIGVNAGDSIQFTYTLTVASGG